MCENRRMNKGMTIVIVVFNDEKNVIEIHPNNKIGELSAKNKHLSFAGWLRENFNHLSNLKWFYL